MKKSTINWCEPDYEMTPYIAEFWNTCSMIPWVILSFNGFCNENLLVIIRIGFFLSFMTAIGSIAFHATLTNWGQTLDELGMLYFGIWGLYLTYPTIDIADIPVFSLIITGFYFSISYTVFVLVFAIITLTIIIGIIKHCQVNMQCAIGITCILLASSCWFIEMKGICTSPIPLHAFWHLGMGIGQYLLLTNI